MTTDHLMKSGFNIIYGYTQSDEISILFHIDESSFKRKLRKINSILAGEASAFFSLQMNSMASFDCRVSQLPNKQLVQEYFRWRQEDSYRNSLNAHCYWLLRHRGNTSTQATAFLSGKGFSEKNQLLLDYGINFNDLPKWQKYGTGLYWNKVTRQGFNPKTGKNVETTRRQIIQDSNLLLGDKYCQFIDKFL